MEIVSAREFRANQSKILTKALNGESILISSRIGYFKLAPVSEEDSLTMRICRSLEEVKKIEAGELRKKAAEDFLNEL